MQRKKHPVFNLQFTETFQAEENEVNNNELEDMASLFGSDIEQSKQNFTENSQAPPAEWNKIYLLYPLKSLL